MNIKRLAYFLEISKTLNITKAAENLHISQPPLTAQLKLLEEELGTVLFIRTTRKLEITEAGEKLKSRASQILELMAMTKDEISSVENDQIKDIRIGFVASSAALLSPEKLISFHKKHNNITFTMKEGNTHKILDLLSHGLIDVGLVRTPFNGEAYYIEYLELEPMIAVYDPEVYNLSDEIELKQLKDLPLVLDKRFLDLIVTTAHQSGIEPRIICKGEDSRSILAWTEAGLGIALLPYSGRFFIKSSKLAYSKINESALDTRSAIVRLKNNNKIIVNDLIEIIK